MKMDWDKLKVFHAAAEAGSFTHAGEQLGLSQSAVSRQVSALEQELSVSLFHRHARGLILTEQGELLYRTAHDVFMKLEAARAKLTDSRERPNGDLRVTTTPGIGVHWLTPRLGEFVDLYPEIHITLLTTDEELDLAMREADVAIRLRQPTQPDLIQRKLFSVHFHVYASPEYLKKFGTPRTFEDLDSHRVLVLGGNVPPYLQRSRWLIEVARDGKGPRIPHLVINNILGILRACQRGLGIAMLPDYLVEENGGLVQLFGEAEAQALDAYFVYPEELKTVARVQAFRDFLVANAQRWNFSHWAIACTAAARHHMRFACFKMRREPRPTPVNASDLFDGYVRTLRCPHGCHVEHCVVCFDGDSHTPQVLPGSRLPHPPRSATVLRAAVPLWKVNRRRPHADELDRARQGPVFFFR
jgi:DNA-binding transcriptional LysR family regulator